MRKMTVVPPVTSLPVAGVQAVRILGVNKKRVGLIINNYGTQTAYLYSDPEITGAGNGFSVFAGFGLAILESCPHSAIYAGQAAAGAILNILEIQEDDRDAQ